MLLTLGDVDVVSWVPVEGCESGVHVHAMLEVCVVSYSTVAARDICRYAREYSPS